MDKLEQDAQRQQTEFNHLRESRQASINAALQQKDDEVENPQRRTTRVV